MRHVLALIMQINIQTFQITVKVIVLDRSKQLSPLHILCAATFRRIGHQKPPVTCQRTLKDIAIFIYRLKKKQNRVHISTKSKTNTPQIIVSIRKIGQGFQPLLVDFWTITNFCFVYLHCLEFNSTWILVKSEKCRICCKSSTREKTRLVLV